MQVGSFLGDKYQLMASIGRGGMGEVFHAIHVQSGMNVAVKVVSRAMIGDLLMARLEREAAAVSRIHSDYIPRLLDVGGTHEGELFLVMELLHGESLAERMKRAGGWLGWEEVHAMGDNVLRALIDAHAAGVIHRDLKPGNIFLEHLHDGSQRAKVLDFGVCKLDVYDGENLTITGESVGTIAYMAPEQIRGASRVDERADLYSFAMVVFEALSGRLAYDASGQIALLASKLETIARRLKPVTQVAIPVGLDALIARCLSRRPGERFANAAELLQAWHALGPPVEPAVLLSLPQPTRDELAAMSASTAPTIEMVPRVALRGSRSAMVIAIATVCLGAAAVFAVVSRHARANAINSALHEETMGRGEGPASGAHPLVSSAASSAAAGEGDTPSNSHGTAVVIDHEQDEQNRKLGLGKDGGAALRLSAGTKRKSGAPAGGASGAAGPGPSVAPSSSSQTWIEKPKY